jgi:hypothetical protein
LRNQPDLKTPDLKRRNAILESGREKIIRSHCQNPIFLIVWDHLQLPFTGAVIGEILKIPCQRLRLIQI